MEESVGEKNVPTTLDKKGSAVKDPKEYPPIYFKPLLEEPQEPVDPLAAEKALEEVKGLLGRTLRILISDGRVVQGEFQCMDKDLNFILGSATEYFGLFNDLDTDVIPADLISHKLGMVVVPGNHIVKVLLLEVDNTDLPEEEV